MTGQFLDSGIEVHIGNERAYYEISIFWRARKFKKHTGETVYYFVILLLVFFSWL